MIHPEYDILRNKQDKLEKHTAWGWYLGIMLTFIPGLNIIGVIIMSYYLEKVRKVSLLYGYYSGKIDGLAQSDYEFNKIKDGRLD
ncbi:MAG: hypothetical protein KKD55_04380 [Candidatus Omnitrophica bacterium]|nr:hypothetical protein [Candidatus Omnitrophota bacterium]